MLQNKIILKKLIPAKIREIIYNLVKDTLGLYPENFFSQEGEDAVLAKFFDMTQKGFYIDVGAHHPIKFSNTYYFYRKGWNGINIDAMPGSMVLFKKKRPRDINLEAAISDKNEKLIYYAFNEPALNGFLDKLSMERNKKENYKIIFKKKIETVMLADILDKYLPAGQNIDFMTIDVEGLDLNVLKSNDWDKYIPRYIVIEMIDSNLRDVFANEVYKFLHKKNYEVVAKTRNTALFKFIDSLS